MAAIGVVCGFILFDILTGIVQALYHGKLNSTSLRKGLYHKITELLSVAGAFLGEQATAYLDIGVELPLVSVVVIYVCIMETISIIENLCEVNPNLGKLFSKYLEKLKQESGDMK